MARTQMIKVGVWEIPGAGKKYHYRAVTVGKNSDWTLYRLPRIAPTTDPELWEKVETGFKSKISAVEFAEEIEE